MAEQMTEEQLLFQERFNTGSSKTNNEDFERDGYLVVKSLWNPDALIRPVPQERGQINYWGKKLDQFSYSELEQQVEGSLAVYSHPQYREIHSGIRLKLENIIGRKLYNTYYYDRFYFKGQELTRHADRDACEISVSLHISSNPAKIEWPFWIKDVQENHVSVVLNPGDMVIYKGCERPHWRHPLKSAYSKKELFFRNLKKLKDDTWYHQIFFHYVLADGIRLQHAGDIGINHEN